VTPKFLEKLCTPGLNTAHRRGRERNSRRRTIKEEVLTEEKNLDVKAIAGNKGPLVLLHGGTVLQNGATGMISLGLTTIEVTWGMAISKLLW
jgi:hypothetical protein